MNRRMVILAVAMCAIIQFSACSSKLVSEAEAKEAGLALINQAFTVNETEAIVKREIVELPESLQSSADWGKNRDKERYYSVAVTDGTYDGFTYYAEVNAQTGVAYHAERNKNLLPSLTTEQKALIQQLQAEHGLPAKDTSLALLDEVGSVAVDWVSQKLQPEQRLLGAINDSSFSDSAQEPLTDINYNVVAQDGTIYYVTVVWPMMEITSVTIPNQSVQ